MEPILSQTFGGSKLHKEYFRVNIIAENRKYARKKLLKIREEKNLEFVEV
jgi:hypothetical protein